MKIKDTNHLRKCRSCQYFVECANDIYIGWCHRNAPQPTSRSNMKELDYRDRIHDAPIVSACFWCGEYKKNKSAKSVKSVAKNKG